MATIKVKINGEWMEVPTFAITTIEEAPKDGNLYARKDGDWSSFEPGDKTNVLILDYETDLANGKTGSTVTAEVSASLLDAVDKGKACVIKSGNSDILSNLQKIGNYVQIIMEQVSSFDGAFLATNTIVSVNTSNNTIANLDSGAVELIDRNDVLSKTNTVSYTPTGDYNPATKKYVDGKTYEKPFLNIAPLLSATRGFGIETSGDVTSQINSLFGSISNFKANYSSYIYVNNNAPVTLNTNLDANNSFMFASVYGGDIGTSELDKLVVVIYNYRYKINDDNTSVSGQYDTVTLRATGEGNKSLMNDGTYKQVLTTDNIVEYNPTGDYNPATKKYVDDNSKTKVEDGGNGNVSKELSPNVFYKFGECSSLTITLGAEISGIYNEYMFEFSSGTAPTTLSVPTEIKWNGGEAPTIEASKTYQVSIVNNLAVIASF